MRGKRAKRRSLKLDRKYSNPIIARFISKVMQDGKKSLAEDLVYAAIEKGSKIAKEEDVVSFVNKAIDNVRPALEIKARRVGGANYQVPMPVSPRRQETLAVRWVVEASRKKSGKSFDEILCDQLVDAYKGEGDAVRKKEDTEKMAEANKAFAHFRW
ncbi:MAG TPA: 30S ribosomal protein S7 [Candidatus Dojkabacteria bacterium]|jgi:small subunit ribosomal protein S7|uniref:Small ribosomal subunit protein uS7 n=1 Tax=Candidatus Dojkabacteria bacterium TaxID=2099670 RepID=A0A847D0H6_9BACT|nr:30S ribosomal protein S7 [Candidatus Dojkabacteria bacterium]NLD25171.1 30S ribosomal protein S7 [Candidatus Dojkabacteria bacterium]HPR91858.1 30S ribosomal protein S7 [Candidatus Dojkabacteria bacterium]HQC39332.1 30S ribosomal protein S7 [Candidatus Dojkabacteria bacterium]HRY74400.1 30S ribosomal protein S7 [Candidatus Dojkabacteria bacterium]